MKKVLLVAKDPVGAALRAVITVFDAAEFVSDAADADIVLAYERSEVITALEETTLPVWQVTARDGEGVNNKRVRHFPILEAVPNLAMALAE